jgi:hypothetical protein
LACLPSFGGSAVSLCIAAIPNRRWSPPSVARSRDRLYATVVPNSRNIGCISKKAEYEIEWSAKLQFHQDPKKRSQVIIR